MTHDAGKYFGSGAAQRVSVGVWHTPVATNLTMTSPAADSANGTSSMAGGFILTTPFPELGAEGPSSTLCRGSPIFANPIKHGRAGITLAQVQPINEDGLSLTNSRIRSHQYYRLQKCDSRQRFKVQSTRGKTIIRISSGR